MRRARPRKAATEGGGTIRFILVVALVAWLFRSLVFAPFSIPSGSMLPTLRIGDYLLVAKWPYGYSRYSFPFQFPSFAGRLLSGVPSRGDVVIFAAQGREEDVVKRVIGLPGDRIKLRGGRLILNGRPVQRSPARPVAIRVSANSPCRRVGAAGIALQMTERDKCVYPAYRETLPNGISYVVIDQMRNARADNFGPVTVPEGHLLFLGDNRDDSLDSRFPRSEGGIGFVPLENVVGRATTVFWSTDGTASYWKPWTWFSALREDRIGKRFSEQR